MKQRITVWSDNNTNRYKGGRNNIDLNAQKPSGPKNKWKTKCRRLQIHGGAKWYKLEVNNCKGELKSEKIQQLINPYAAMWKQKYNMYQTFAK